MDTNPISSSGLPPSWRPNDLDHKEGDEQLLPEDVLSAEPSSPMRDVGSEGTPIAQFATLAALLRAAKE